MAITQDDFKKIWASTSSVPEYTFSDADYQKGWEVVGNLPPTRAMWDTLQRRNDQKMKYLQDNGSMCFDSVADMVATDLDAGQTVLTKGYYSVNDGDASVYTIRAKDVADVDDGENIIFLDNGNVAEKIQELTIDYSNDGWFKFGILDKPYYCNGLASDGENFYIGFGFYNTTGYPYICKYDSNGTELARYTSPRDSGMHGGLTWHKKQGCLYAVESTNRILKLSSSLQLLEEIAFPDGAYQVSYDEVYDKFYVINTSYVYQYNSDFTERIATYNNPVTTVGSLNTYQSAMVYGNRFFQCLNYPNTIIEYNLISGKQIKVTSFGLDMDSTYLGEIQGLCAYKTDNGIALFVSFSLSAMGYLYSEVFSLNAPVADLTPFPVSTKRNRGTSPYVSYYVDAESNASYSDGSSDYPWKSLVECMMHTALKTRFEIYVVNADTTIDRPNTAYVCPAGNYSIYLQGKTPNAYFRFRDSFVDLFYRTTNSYEFSFYKSVVHIDTTHADANPQNLIVSARRSHVAINGDVYKVFNVDSTVNIIGKATQITSETGNYGTNFVNDNQNLPIHSKYLKIANGSGISSFKLTCKNTGCAMSALVSISCNSNAGANALFWVVGYGVGGTLRTFVDALRAGNVTATVDNDSNTVTFTGVNVGYDVFVNAVVLNPDQSQNILLEPITP